MTSPPPVPDELLVTIHVEPRKATATRPEIKAGTAQYVAVVERKVPDEITEWLLK